MEHRREIRKSILTFLALTFLLSSIFYFLIITRGGMRAAGGLYVLGLMWCPGIAAVITKLLYRKNLRGMGWGWGKTRYQLLSYALPLLYSATSYVFVWVTGLGVFSGRAFDQLDKQFRSGGMALNSRAAVILLYFFVSLTVGFVTSAVLALGEELGWRGLLVPETAKVTSYTKTALLTGIVWSVWHYPLILFSNYNNRTPVWFGLTCFTVVIVGINFALVWLRLKSGSLWTGVIFHAAHNLFIQSVFTPLTARRPITKYFIDEFGMTLALASLVVAYYFWRRRAEVEGQQRSGSAGARAEEGRQPLAAETRTVYPA